MRWHNKALLIFLITGSVTPTMGFAADAFEAGIDWLKWSNNARVVYVSAYLLGQGRGFRDGCVLGEELYSAKVNGLPGEKCIAKLPTYSKTPETYAATITEYYRSYPRDRDVPIFKILEGLSDARALTLRQMHEYFPGSVRR
jgi:hypothetical protein